MQDLIQIAGGTIVGRDHILAGKNNQDAFHYQILPEASIAVVCDGCGSGLYSEVGAKLGARMVVATIAQVLSEHPDLPPQIPGFWEAVERRLLLRLRCILKTMAGNWAELIRDYFLFTIVGSVITPTEVITFSLGDGCLCLNGQFQELGPFANNAPPYLSYGLLEDRNRSTTPFQIHHCLPCQELTSLLIGTDGVTDLARAATIPFPGKTNPIGPLSQFWEQDSYFTNPDRIRRTLTLANRDIHQPDWENRQMQRSGGLLPDDTTLIVIRPRLNRRDRGCESALDMHFAETR